MNFPSDLKYSKEHEWVRVDGNIATIGVSDFAQHELGDIVYVDVATVGQVLEQNTVFGTIEAVKTVSDLFMPVSGKILELNAGLADDPEAVNKDPYAAGWIIKAELQNAEELAHLMDAVAYQKHIGL